MSATVEQQAAEAPAAEQPEKEEAEKMPVTVEQQSKEAPAAGQPEKQEAEKKSKAKKKKAKAAERAKEKEMAAERNEKPYVYVPRKKKDGKPGKKKNKKPSPSDEQAEATMADVFGFGPVTGAMEEETVMADLFGFGPMTLAGKEEKKSKKEKYMRQIYESQGFDIDDFPPGYKSAPIVPYHHVDDEDDEWLNDQCKKALTKYNSVNGSHYEFVKVEKANLRPCAGFVIFLTFQARKPDTDSLIAFQARVYDAVEPKTSTVEFCRRKKGPSKPNSAAQAPSPGPTEGVEDSEDDKEQTPNTLSDVFQHMKEKGVTVEDLGTGQRAGHTESRAWIDGFQHWFADDIEEDMVLQQLRIQPIVGVLDFYPSLYKQFKGNGVYLGPTEEELRRREKKLQRDEHYAVPGHSVLIYGCGVDADTGEAYYDVKNSWGVTWADDGYGKIKRSLFNEFAFPSIHGLRVE